MQNLLKNTQEYKNLLANVNTGGTFCSAVFGLPPAGRAQLAALLLQETGRPVLVVTGDEAAATRFAADAAFFGAAAMVYPERDFALRSMEGQNHAAEYRRLQVLGSLVGGRCNMVCAPVQALLQHTIPKDEFLAVTLTLEKGAKIKKENLRAALLAAGYYRRDLVEGPGQFAVRGGVVDIFPPDTALPVRLELWGDEIEGLWAFDLLSQRRDTKVKKLHISPAREVLFNGPEEALAFLEKETATNSAAFKAAAEKDVASLKAGVLPQTMDKYLPLRYKKPGLLLEYMETPILFIDEPAAVKAAQEGAEALWQEDLKTLLEEGVLCKELTAFYEPYSYLLQKAAHGTTLLCENFARTVADYKLTHNFNLPAHLLPIWGGAFAPLLEDITPLLAEKYAVQVLAGTKRAAAALTRDFEAAGIPTASTGTLQHGSVQVAVGALSGGVNYPFARFAVITGRGGNTTEEKKKVKRPKGTLTALEDITPGDLVVHQNYGIGIYSGIQRLDMQGAIKDYLRVNYAGKDVLYVPVTQMDLLSRYTAPGDTDKVKLSKLSGDSWAKTKSRVRQATAEMAEELLALYAKRQQSQGHAFRDDSEWQRDFETRFDYEETEDQLVAAAEIKKDMEKPTPMDRLLCGDVGVGKTEVALRAIFKCIMGGKQVAVLVPTTILAWQHYNTFLRRLEAFPVNVDMLSRFRSPGQVKNTLRMLKDGRCDVVVGTHRLLQKDVSFKNLGLLVVDEEQRFGVKHKEALKEAFPGVDVLTLSATPIPRTLNMAMSGIRDMSAIETPPFDRQPVETYVLEHNDAAIAAAIRRELARAGQVYYLHNRIDTIARTAAKVEGMAPGARVGIAHGRMAEEELSSVWQKLLNGEIDILVCTTLIETGVDVPNCNTLIIEDADRMGLAQLYQIRGRVGRSGRKAYAYFTFRQDKVLTEIAAKRLSAIREFTTFGSGLRIAMRDMQIRGAGNLLGKSQHGHMEAVGYDLYVKLLNEAVALQKGETLPTSKADCLIDIAVDAYIPTNYIESAPGRIEIYKAIAAIEGEEDAAAVVAELQDRFGPPPAAVLGLIDISLVRVAAAKLGIYEISQKRDTLLLYSDKVNGEMVRPLLKSMGHQITVNSSAKPYISVRVPAGQTAAGVMAAALSTLAGAQ